ncbi:hypothetical protein GCM10022226_00400 [Sphaerisporangium flaviroseum]|uniref:Uncharacterized protein n=1 Tax=Sphaerisporangium flaviroseum TaxID=509199 RepID=A0ABP7HDS5_9ACTN
MTFPASGLARDGFPAVAARAEVDAGSACTLFISAVLAAWGLAAAPHAEAPSPQRARNAAATARLGTMNPFAGDLSVSNLRVFAQWAGRYP